MIFDVYKAKSRNTCLSVNTFLQNLFETIRVRWTRGTGSFLNILWLSCCLMLSEMQNRVPRNHGPFRDQTTTTAHAAGSFSLLFSRTHSCSTSMNFLSVFAWSSSHPSRAIKQPMPSFRCLNWRKNGILFSPQNCLAMWWPLTHRRGVVICAQTALVIQRSTVRARGYNFLSSSSILTHSLCLDILKNILSIVLFVGDQDNLARTSTSCEHWVVLRVSRSIDQSERQNHNELEIWGWVAKQNSDRGIVIFWPQKNKKIPENQTENLTVIFCLLCTHSCANLLAALHWNRNTWYHRHFDDQTRLVVLPSLSGSKSVQISVDIFFFFWQLTLCVVYSEGELANFFGWPLRSMFSVGHLDLVAMQLYRRTNPSVLSPVSTWNPRLIPQCSNKFVQRWLLLRFYQRKLQESFLIRSLFCFQ